MRVYGRPFIAFGATSNDGKTSPWYMRTVRLAFERGGRRTDHRVDDDDHAVRCNAVCVGMVRTVGCWVTGSDIPRGRCLPWEPYIALISDGASVIESTPAKTSRKSARLVFGIKSIMCSRLLIRLVASDGKGDDGGDARTITPSMSGGRFIFALGAPATGWPAHNRHDKLCQQHVLLGAAKGQSKRNNQRATHRQTARSVARVCRFG
jgi:hypothetical protein